MWCHGCRMSIDKHLELWNSFKSLTPVAGLESLQEPFRQLDVMYMYRWCTDTLLTDVALLLPWFGWWALWRSRIGWMIAIARCPIMLLWIPATCSTLIGYPDGATSRVSAVVTTSSGVLGWMWFRRQLPNTLHGDTTAPTLKYGSKYHTPDYAMCVVYFCRITIQILHSGNFSVWCKFCFSLTNLLPVSYTHLTLPTIYSV